MSITRFNVPDTPDIIAVTILRIEGRWCIEIETAGGSSSRGGLSGFQPTAHPPVSPLAPPDCPLPPEEVSPVGGVETDLPELHENTAGGGERGALANTFNELDLKLLPPRLCRLSGTAQNEPQAPRTRRGRPVKYQDGLTDSQRSRLRKRGLYAPAGVTSSTASSTASSITSQLPCNTSQLPCNTSQLPCITSHDCLNDCNININNLNKQSYKQTSVARKIELPRITSQARNTSQLELTLDFPLPEAIETEATADAWIHWIKHRRAFGGCRNLSIPALDAVFSNLTLAWSIGGERAVVDTLENSVRLNRYSEVRIPADVYRFPTEAESKTAEVRAAQERRTAEVRAEVLAHQSRTEYEKICDRIVFLENAPAGILPNRDKDLEELKKRKEAFECQENG